MLGGRQLSMIARELVRPRNYVSLLRMVWVFPAFPAVAWRYLSGRGSYPYRCRVRTPAGVVAPTLYSPHDVFTVNEIFCRGDYASEPAPGTVVDVGSNIGLSALYFLTRGVECRCWLHEPVAQNVERLRRNLAGHEASYELREVAVAAEAGTAEFGVEPTGRYGGIGVATAETISVECVALRTILEEALEESGSIDVLKIDTEGTELELLRSVAPQPLGAVGRVFLEWADRTDSPPEPFTVAFRNDTWVLSNPAPRRGDGVVR